MSVICCVMVVARTAGESGGLRRGSTRTVDPVKLHRLWRTTYRNTIRIFLADALGFGLALLKGVLVLKLAAHFDGVVID